MGKVARPEFLQHALTKWGHRDLLSVTRSYRCLQLRTPSHRRPPRLRLRCVQGMLSSLDGASPPANLMEVICRFKPSPQILGAFVPLSFSPNRWRLRLLPAPILNVVSVLFLPSSRTVLPVGASAKAPFLRGVYRFSSDQRPLG